MAKKSEGRTTLSTLVVLASPTDGWPGIHQESQSKPSVKRHSSQSCVAIVNTHFQTGSLSERVTGPSVGGRTQVLSVREIEKITRIAKAKLRRRKEIGRRKKQQPRLQLKIELQQHNNARNESARTQKDENCSKVSR